MARKMGNSDREPEFVWSTMVFSFSNSCERGKLNRQTNANQSMTFFVRSVIYLSHGCT